MVLRLLPEVVEVVQRPVPLPDGERATDRLGYEFFGQADGEPILRRHTMAAFGLAADHDEQNLAQADMFLS